MENKRTCGECTLCCYTHAIQDNNKQIIKGPMQNCEHCEVGVGCKIYTDPIKPQSCATFRCLWLYGAGGSEDRPDKLGLVVVAERNGSEDTLRLTATKQDALSSKFAGKLITFAFKKDALVIYTSPEGQPSLVVTSDSTLSTEDEQRLSAKGIGVKRFSPSQDQAEPKSRHC